MNRVILLAFLFQVLVLPIAPGDCDSCQLTREPSVLQVGIVEDNLFPFLYHDDQGRPMGFELDLIKNLGKALDLEHIRVNTYPNRQALTQGLLHGEVDCGVSRLKRNLHDGEVLLYSQSYLELGSVFLVNRRLQAQLRLQTETPNNFSDAVSIGTLEEDNFYGPLRKNFPSNRIEKSADFAQLIEQVLHGQLMACVIDEARAKRYFHDHPENALLLAYMPWNQWSDAVALAFSWDNRPLRDLSNIFLQSQGPLGLDDLIKSYTDHATRQETTGTR